AHAERPVEPRVDREGVVAEHLARLDVVLPPVGPVEEGLLAVVRHGEALPGGAVPPTGDEVAVLVVSREEVVQVVEDLALQRLVGAGRGDTGPGRVVGCTETPTFAQLGDIQFYAPGASVLL